jgi:hypothetical protein
LIVEDDTDVGGARGGKTHGLDDTIAEDFTEGRGIDGIGAEFEVAEAQEVLMLRCFQRVGQLGIPSRRPTR